MAVLAVPWLVLDRHRERDPGRRGRVRRDGPLRRRPGARRPARRPARGPAPRQWPPTSSPAPPSARSPPCTPRACSRSPSWPSWSRPGGAARGAGDSARDVLVPGVNDLAGAPIERSSGLYDGVYRLGSLIGAPVAGALVTLVSAEGVLAADAASFAASAAVVAWAVPAAAQPPREPRPPGEGAYLAALREGLRYLRRDRLRSGSPPRSRSATLSTRQGPRSCSRCGRAGSCTAPPPSGCSAARSRSAPSPGTRSPPGSAPGSAAAYPGGRVPAGRRTRYLAVAFLAGLAPVLGAAFASGLGAGCINPVIGAVEYERVPRHLQARVLGTLGALAFAGIPLGGLLAAGRHRARPAGRPGRRGARVRPGRALAVRVPRVARHGPRRAASSPAAAAPGRPGLSASGPGGSRGPRQAPRDPPGQGPRRPAQPPARPRPRAPRRRRSRATSAG